MKILIAVDGSPGGNRAADQVVAMAALLKEPPQVFLLNVQWNIVAGNVKLFINQQVISDYYREQGAAALAAARARLDAAGLPYTYHISVGLPGEAIAQYAREQQVDQIVMGMQGESALSTLLLGSVVQKVLHLAPVPVLLVR